MNKPEIAEKLKHIFATTDAKLLHVAEDGQVFHEKADALNHSKGLSLDREPATVTRDNFKNQLDSINNDNRPVMINCQTVDKNVNRDQVKESLKYVFSTTDAKKVYMNPDGSLFLELSDAYNAIDKRKSNQKPITFNRSSFLAEVESL